MKPLSFLLVGIFISSLTALSDVLQADAVESAAATDAQVVSSQDRDIGAVAVAGSASNNGTGAFTVTASGADIWGTADEFHYVYFSIAGDIELVARVTGEEFTDGCANAGL